MRVITLALTWGVVIGLVIGAGAGGALAGLMLWVILHRKFQAGSIWPVASLVGGSTISALSVTVSLIFACFASMVGALSVVGWVMIIGIVGMIVGLVLVVIPIYVSARRSV